MDPRHVAQTILAGFNRHYTLFREMSAAARARFERSDWNAVADARRGRIDMYDQRVAETVAKLQERFPETAQDETLWRRVKLDYIPLLYEHLQPECAETFFNSVARRVLDRRYHRNDHIFRRPVISTEHLTGQEPAYRSYYPTSTDLAQTFTTVMQDFAFGLRFADLGRDVGYLVCAIDEAYPNGWEVHPNFQFQVLRSAFYRNKEAYVVGRVINGSHILPFVIPLVQDAEHRLVVDTILLDRKGIGRMFSLGRAYFMVDMEVPSAFVAFLETVVPGKTRAELYTLVGLQKQGKTLFFRDLEHHLRNSSDPFTIAPGTRGMVMVVFTLPSFPYVFKVIRDWFQPPKDVDRATVEDRYRYVKLHDRVGRMADTLEYADVAFPAARFTPELIAELERLAPSCVEREGDEIIIRHFYTERRMVPLDLYLQKADAAHRDDSISEFGNALKDLAAANIFPGDLLAKNFGVTRFGRVVFYDYDELCELTECTFRRMPTPSNDEDEMRGEAYFSVGPRDIFPEQFPTFLFPEGPLRDSLMRMHPEIADPAAWIVMQDRARTGVAEQTCPYGEEVRFKNRYAAAAKPAA